MALTKTEIIPAGIDVAALYEGFETCVKTTETIVENVYIKIIGLQGTKEKVSFSLGIYSAKDGKLLCSRHYQFVPSVADDSDNFIAQGYDYLKTLPEFADATDC